MYRYWIKTIFVPLINHSSLCYIFTQIGHQHRSVVVVIIITTFCKKLYMALCKTDRKTTPYVLISRLKNHFTISLYTCFLLSPPRTKLIAAVSHLYYSSLDRVTPVRNFDALTSCPRVGVSCPLVLCLSRPLLHPSSLALSFAFLSISLTFRTALEVCWPPVCIPLALVHIHVHRHF